jgi:hypothetical protein
VKALGDAVHQELGGRSSEGMALKFTEKLGMRWGHVVASNGARDSGGAEHRIAYNFILHEQREPLAEENEAASNWERTRIEECSPKN